MERRLVHAGSCLAPWQENRLQPAIGRTRLDTAPFRPSPLHCVELEGRSLHQVASRRFESLKNAQDDRIRMQSTHENGQTRKLHKIKQVIQALHCAQCSAIPKWFYMSDATADTASKPRERSHAGTAPCRPAAGRKDEGCVDVLAPRSVDVVIIAELGCVDVLAAVVVNVASIAKVVGFLAVSEVDDIVVDAVVVVSVCVLMPVEVDDVIVVVKPPAHLEAPVQVSYNFRGAKMPAPPKEQSRIG